MWCEQNSNQRSLKFINQSNQLKPANVKALIHSTLFFFSFWQNVYSQVLKQWRQLKGRKEKCINNWMRESGSHFGYSYLPHGLLRLCLQLISAQRWIESIVYEKLLFDRKMLRTGMDAHGWWHLLGPTWKKLGKIGRCLFHHLLLLLLLFFFLSFYKFF